MNALDEIKTCVKELLKKDQKNLGNILVEYISKPEGLIEVSNEKFPKCRLKVLEDSWKNGIGKTILKKEYDTYWAPSDHLCKHF